jgi:hypothetical protein
MYWKIKSSSQIRYYSEILIVIIWQLFKICVWWDTQFFYSKILLEKWHFCHSQNHIEKNYEWALHNTILIDINYQAFHFRHELIHHVLHRPQKRGCEIAALYPHIRANAIWSVSEQTRVYNNISCCGSREVIYWSGCGARGGFATGAKDTPPFPAPKLDLSPLCILRRSACMRLTRIRSPHP